MHTHEYGRSAAPPTAPPVMTTDQVANWMALLLVLVVAVAYLRSRKWRLSSTAHGSASVATDAQLRRAGFFRGQGLLIGRSIAGRLIHLPRYVHLAIFAPTGAGKGVSFLIPWLLTYTRGSVMVNDLPQGKWTRS